MAVQFNERSRFTDINDEPIERLLSPIKGYENQPLLPLSQTIKPVSKLFYEIQDYVFTALNNCQNPANGLTQDESASIHLYTMQFQGGPSLYFLLNQSLRAENRDHLIPWFPYLKLFLTALHKLPSQSERVWRGVKNIDLNSKYKKGTKFAWWGVSSCTSDIEIMKSNCFLGKTGVRTLFSIDCINAKSIAHHSYFKNQEKEIILMPGSYFEVIGQLNPAPDLHIIQLKEIPPPIPFVKSPYSSLPVNVNVLSISHKPDIVSPKPHINSPKPDIISPKPHIISPKPDIIAPKPPYINSPKPYINSPKPHIILPPTPSISSKSLASKSIQLNIPNNAKWIQNEITVVGGNGKGNGLNQLFSALGICMVDSETIYVADQLNHRIMKWKKHATIGRVVAGGNGQGNRNDQLNRPYNVMVDHEHDSLIISDQGNRRVVRWPRQNGTSGETIISNVDCCGLAMDNKGYLYVSDVERHEVRRWKIGEKNGTLVAGGHGEGSRLDQFNRPYFIFVDENQSVYVSDWGNHRVMKWIKGAKEGIIVAGGHGPGNSLTQLSSPYGIIIDQIGTVYIADFGNHRIMRWFRGARHGDVIIDGNDNGKQVNELSSPIDLSFDRQNNLYLVDYRNHRIQKFSINSSKSN